MTRILVLTVVIAVLCARARVRAQGEKENCANGAEKVSKPPSTLFEWRYGKEVEDKKDEEEEPLEADRPDFVEATKNVGKGRIQLESGYTYTQDRSGGTTTRTHAYPEMVLRVGLIADWIELRVGQNFGNERATGLDPASRNGANDLYLGIGIGLTEEKGLCPDSRIILQMQAPTGSNDFTAKQVLPGFNLLYGWDIIKDQVTFSGSSQLNRAQDDAGNYYITMAQAVTSGITITKKVGSYIETFCLFPSGAQDGQTGPEWYLDGGFLYKFSPNFQVDIRAGVGLNRHANDFFTGAGFAVRF